MMLTIWIRQRRKRSRSVFETRIARITRILMAEAKRRDSAALLATASSSSGEQNASGVTLIRGESAGDAVAGAAVFGRRARGFAFQIQNFGTEIDDPVVTIENFRAEKPGHGR